MDIFFAILIIGGFFYFNSRISAIEKKVSSQEAKQQLVVSPPSEIPIVHTVSAAPTIRATTIAVPATSSAKFDEESGGRWLGRLGIAALFVGVAFFLKYAFDTGLIGILGRVILGVVTGLIFIGAGQYLRAKYEQYAHLLIGGGVAILYLSGYAAYDLYHLISQPAAFALMLAVTATTVLLSIINDSLPLAILAALGGFVTPYFISTGRNDLVALFTYITLLDIAVVALAVRKNWHILTYISFICSGLQFYMWYGSYYSPDQLITAFTFLTFFFVIYLLVPSITTYLNGGKLHEKNLMLATVNAIAYFTTAYFLLLNPTYHSNVWVFALVLGVVYCALGYVEYLGNKIDTLLSRYYLGIATIFATIAIPLKLEHSWITLAWLLEAALLYAIAFKYKRIYLQLLAGMIYIVGIWNLFYELILKNHAIQVTPFFNEHFALFLVAIAIAYFISYLYYKYPVGVDESNAVFAHTFFIVANILSVYIITSQISLVYDSQLGSQSGLNNYFGNGNDLTNQRNTVISIFWSIYSIVLIAIGFGTKARIARLLGLIFFFITAFKVFIDVWTFGELYRIVASIVFGAIALLGSFMYVKYSQRIKELIYKN